MRVGGGCTAPVGLIGITRGTACGVLSTKLKARDPPGAAAEISTSR